MDRAVSHRNIPHHASSSIPNQNLRGLSSDAYVTVTLGGHSNIISNKNDESTKGGGIGPFDWGGKSSLGGGGSSGNKKIYSAKTF